jgi:hypothetical protein
VSNFKNLARSHQTDFLKTVLKCEHVKNLPCMLSENDARLGKIFYDGFDRFMKVVEERYSFENRKSMYANMLRSEHIPFNFFVPFQLNNKSHYLADILNRCIPGMRLSEVNFVEIEWAPPGRGKYLDDHTSFDVYVRGKNGSKNVGFGIEIKYTELSYPYGGQEKDRMFDPEEKSRYHGVTKASEFYVEGAIPILRKKDLKQIWRNHLLGISMVSHAENDIQEFYSILLYPAQNTYQEKVCGKYSSLLRPDAQRYFVGLTYEEFLKNACDICADDPSYILWIEYLLKRYLISGNEVNQARIAANVIP